MVYHNGCRVDFLYLRTEQQFLYVGTIQLLPDVCGAGIGTLLMQYVERVAIEDDYAGIRLLIDKPSLSILYVLR